MSVLTPAETLIAARRLAGARPHLAAVAGIVHREDLWRLCRDELTGLDVRADCWDIRGRWFGVVVVATPRLRALGRGETIPWRVVATLIAPKRGVKAGDRPCCLVASSWGRGRTSLPAVGRPAHPAGPAPPG